MRYRLSVIHWLAVLTAILGSFSALATHGGDKNVTWCDIPDIAEETQEVLITFNINLEAISRIFSDNLALYIYTHFKDSEDEGDRVFTCWVNETSSFHCLPNAMGYNLSLSGNNSMTLIIAKASIKRADRYVLKTDGPPLDMFVSCNLTLRREDCNHKIIRTWVPGNIDVNDVTFSDTTGNEGVTFPATPGNERNVTFPASTGSGDDAMLLVTTRNFIPVEYIYLVAVAVVAVAAAAAVIAAAVVLIKKRKLGKRRQLSTCCNRSLEDGQEKTAFNEKDITFPSDTFV